MQTRFSRGLPLLLIGALLGACGHQPVRPANGAANPTPSITGIPACDAYLSSYLACHRAAGIFAPDQLQGRYQAMRDSLLQGSQDPQVRPQLAARCTMLASQLRDALQGRSCDPAPAAASSVR